MANGGYTTELLQASVSPVRSCLRCIALSNSRSVKGSRTRALSFSARLVTGRCIARFWTPKGGFTSSQKAVYLRTDQCTIPGGCRHRSREGVAGLDITGSPDRRSLDRDPGGWHVPAHEAVNACAGRPWRDCFGTDRAASVLLETAVNLVSYNIYRESITVDCDYGKSSLAGAATPC